VAAEHSQQEAVAARPNFFIVGAPRCGTTAMYEYLRQHPDVFMPYRKEPVFFGPDLSKRPPPLDESAYLRLFAGGRGKRRIGEATTWYLYSASAASEIHAFSPAARIIIMLRNPVDMIYSLHGHWLFTGNEDIADFAAALDAESDRRRGDRLPKAVRRPEGLQYRALGRYAAHVRRYLEVFGPDAVKVIIYDDFQADPAGSYRATLEFLGVDTDFQAEFAVINRSKDVRSPRLQRLIYARPLVRAMSKLPGPVFHAARRSMLRLNIKYQPRPPLDIELRARLTAEFSSDIDELGRLIGRDLSAWQEPTVHVESAQDNGRA
jgi:hypothetical protein